MRPDPIEQPGPESQPSDAPGSGTPDDSPETQIEPLAPEGAPPDLESEAAAEPATPEAAAEPVTSEGEGDPATAETSVHPPAAQTAAIAGQDVWGAAPSAQEAVADEGEEATDGAGAPPAQEKKHGERPRGVLAFISELPVLLLIAFILALLIKTFLIQAFFIPSESMESTLNVGDRVLVNKVVYHLHPPRRGDVIVFEDPHPAVQPHRNPVSAFWHWLTEGLGLSTSPEKDFIKRVIGLPGDVVECKLGTVYINGQRLNEPYVTFKDERDCGPVTVPGDSLFVMGDNRPNSMDSRAGLGFIPYDKVIGRAFVIIWPPSRIGWLRGP